MRTPEGTSEKNLKPAELTNSYFSVMNVGHYIRPWDFNCYSIIICCL